MLAILIDPGELDAADFVAGIADAAPDLLITGAGASGGAKGSRVFMNGEAHSDACVGLLFPATLHPTVGMTQGCQGLTEPMTITAAEGNLILEIEGRSPIDILEQALAEPRNRGLGQITGHLLAGIGDIVSDGRSDYVVRPFAVAEADPRALAVAEPVRAGQTIRFTLRDAIGARDDMKAMLDEQAEAHNRRAGALRGLLQLRGPRQRSLRQAGAGSGVDPPSLRPAASDRDRELVRDCAGLRPVTHSHVHRRAAARRLKAGEDRLSRSLPGRCFSQGLPSPRPSPADGRR